MKDKTACFTGYRPMKCPWKFNEDDPRCLVMKENAKSLIINAINEGYHTFITGMALGFDLICAEIVLALKKQYPHIRLIGAIPCKNQEIKWTQAQKARYREILAQLNDAVYIAEEYNGKCMLERNRYMVDNSSLCIALFDGLTGGTKKTLAYASQKGIKIQVIAP